MVKWKFLRKRKDEARKMMKDEKGKMFLKRVEEELRLGELEKK